ncbi:unnamed protein product [Schistosoma rodhaini]|uniref:Uncharacterized protein n=1 Tax=Schistosoma rodhaini TaxID=6188 RepID=A0A183R2X4_9TREM|nr:unnamed protein product [Schistosoma rodhaini]
MFIRQFRCDTKSVDDSEEDGEKRDDDDIQDNANDEKEDNQNDNDDNCIMLFNGLELGRPVSSRNSSFSSDQR